MEIGSCEGDYFLKGVAVPDQKTVWDIKTVNCCFYTLVIIRVKKRKKSMLVSELERYC